jgi:hypothetical protein
MKLILKLVVSAGLLLAGCVPFTVGVGRHTAGTVISQETRRPIVGAEIIYEGYPKTAVATGEDGRFVLEHATVTKWLVPVPADYFGWVWHPLTVRAEGYRTRTYAQTAQEPATPILIELVPSR